MLDQLSKLSVTELCHFHGIGPAKAVGIVAALELGRRRKELNLKTRKTRRIASRPDVFKVMLPLMQDLVHEEFWMISLNRAHHITSHQKIDRKSVGKGKSVTVSVDHDGPRKSKKTNNTKKV